MLAEKLDDWTEQWKREGLEKGRQEGRQEGRLQGQLEGRQQEAAVMLLRFLSKRFGPVDEATRQKVEASPVEQLEAWGDRVLDANSLDDVFLSSGD